MKTISMRIRGAKTELEDAGESTEGMVESTAKLRQEIMALSGVDIMLDKDNFKSTYQIMDELSQKWEDLSDISQATIIELMAGKHQGNVFASLISNFQTARDALDTSLNSSGSAMKEHEKWSQSLEAQILKLKASWQGLSQSFLSSDFLKVTLDVVIKLVDALTLLTDTFGGFGVIALGLAGKGIWSHFHKGKKTITDVANAVEHLTDVMQNGTNVTNEATQANERNAASEMMEAEANNVSAVAESQEAAANTVSTTSELAEVETNTASATSELTEVEANAVSTTSELAEVEANAASAASELAEAKANTTSATTEAEEAAANAISTASELAEAEANTASAASELTEATNNVANSATESAEAMAGFGSTVAGVGKSATKTAAGGLTSLLGKLGSLITAHPYIAAAVAIVGALTAAFIYQKKKAEELAKKVDELTDSYKQNYNELKKLEGDFDTSNESSMISKYEKLSKGVDSLGRNVSLTSEEYSEYQSIVNSVAEQIPSLISGYDEQGNALLSCKGNVEALTEAYEKLIHAQNQEILTNTSDIEKDFANKTKDANGDDWWGKLRESYSNLPTWAKFLNNVNPVTSLVGVADTAADWTSGNKMTTDTAKTLEDLLNGDRDNVNDIIASYDKQTMSEIETALKDAGVDVGFLGGKTAEALEKTLKNEPAKIKGIVDDFYAEVEETVEQQKLIATAKLSEAFDVSSAISGLNYGNIGEELQAIAYQTVNSLDFDFFSKLSESGKTVEQWTTEMLNQLNAISKTDNAKIEAGFELQTQFNGGEISYGEYVKNLQNIESVIDSLNLKSEAKEQLKISLGLDDEGVIDQYNALVKRLTDSKNYDFDISETEAKKLLDGLSSEELAVAVDVITEMSNNDVKETADEIKTAIERELTLQGLTLDLDIKAEATKLESLKEAITQSFSGSGLSVDVSGEDAVDSISVIEGMFKGLSSYDPSKLFERTANGIRLNSDELRRLNNEYRETNINAINNEMDSLGDIYNQTREELYRLTYGTDEYNAKAAELSGIEERIKATETLLAQYEGLASAYQSWQMAEEAGSQRDMYESIIEGFENIDDEIKRGWYDDGTIEFLELLSGKDLSTAGIEEVKKAYSGLKKEIKNTGYTVRDFFTTDEDGNSTNTGVYNFLKAIDKLEKSEFGGKDVVKRNDKNKIIGFDFQVVGGDEVIAETLGISEELVQIMVRAADDAGFVVSMDGTYQQLDVLKEKAQEASESLNRILEKNGKKGFDFNFNSSDVEDITKQLGEAKNILDTFRNTDGTINTKLEGADEALTVASTLQSMLDKLSRPTYMDIEVSQVEDELQEPLRNLQELRRLLETEHQLKLTGADTSQLEESKQEVYEYFEGLDTDVKVKLGLVDDKGNPLTGNALKDKLNSGDIAIEATVDIQMKMDDKLGILVDKALLDAGIIDGKEFEKRVDVYLNADVDNTDAKNKTEQAVNEVADGKGGKSSSKSDKSSGNKVEKKVDVYVKADEVDASNVKDKAKEAVEKESEERLAVETTVELETTIEEATDLIQKFEDKDITIDVKVKGLNEVKELNKQIDLATDIDGSVDKLSEYVEGAKALSELDDNISSFVTAEVKGNVIDEFEYKLNNLKVFSDSAKDLDDIGFVNSEVTANVKGNVIDEFEYKIDNLKVFSDSAKDLGDIGNVESNVKATINSGENGDVIDEFEYKLDNLGEFAEHVKKLQGLGDVDISVKATINSGENGDVIDEFEYKLDNLSEFANHVKKLQGLQSVDISVNASVNTGENGDVVDTFEYKLNNLGKFADYVKELQGLDNVDVSVNATVNTGNDGDAVDTFEYKLNNLETFAEGAKALQGVGNVSSEITAKVNTGESGDAIDTFEYKLDNLSTFAEGAKALKGIGNVDVSVSAKVNTGESGDVIDTFEYKLDNLDEFADYAKELQGLENVDISIKANVNTGEAGDVVDTFEYKLDNLGDFADYAKSLQGLESVDITITANAKGNVVGEKTEGKINNLEVFAKGAKGLSNIESKEITITANAKGNVVGKKTEGKINNLEVFAQGAKKIQSLESKDITITANAKGNVVGKKTEGKINNLEVFAKGAKSLQGVSSKDVTITANAKGNVVGKKTEGKINNLKVFGDSAKTLNGVSSKEVTITANANGNVVSGEGSSSRLSSLTEFKSLISGMSSQTVTVSVTANVDSEKINSAIDLLTKVANSGVFKNYSATVQVGAKISTVDDTTVKNYKAPPKEGKVSYSVNPESSVFTWAAPSKNGVVNYSAEVEALTSSQKHKTGTITYKANIIGLGGIAAGTAHANGSASGRAFARGNWGIKGNGVALGGEMGTELVVRNGKWFTIGDQGAEFFRYKKNDIVFNAAQTESLFKYGGIKGANPRGKMLATGTAFADGTAFAGGSKGSGGGTESEVKSYSAGKSSSSKKKSSSSSADEFEETIDWIEIALSRIEREIDRLDKKANSSYKSWSERNKALTNEISKVGDEIELQQQAYDRYMREANSVGLDESYAKKVRDGSINIQDFEGENNEALVEKIKEYQEWYEKALDCQDAIDDLKEKEAELYKQRFDNVSTRYDGTLAVIEHEKNMLDEYISQAEVQGHLVSENYYKALMVNEGKNQAALIAKRAELLNALAKGMADGTITKDMEVYDEMIAEIDATTLAIEESNTALLEYKQTLQQLDWEVFDLIQERISKVTEEADFLIDLMSNDKLYDDNGNLTDEGMATIGLHGQNYNVYMHQADDYGAKAAELDRQIMLDPFDQELIDKRDEYLSLQRESILAAEDEKQAIVDLVEEGINIELDALQERIDKYNESLDAAKDLYDYNKRVKEQTKEIASLEKQMAAYAGDDSEESKARIQELKVSLEDAKADLEQTEYEKYISDQKALLDELYLQYETVLNQRLDNTDALIAEVVAEVNANAATISTTISEESANVGYTLSEEMRSIWNENAIATQNVIAMYGTGFSLAQTTTNQTLSRIETGVYAMTALLGVKAAAQSVKAATSSTAKSPQANTKPKTETKPKAEPKPKPATSGGDGKAKVGDKVKFVSGQYYYDSYGTKPLGSQERGNYVYITYVNEKGSHPYHISRDKANKHPLGWLKKEQISEYATGKQNFLDDEIAWTQENGREFIVRPSDGAILTPIAKSDSVLNANASNNIWNMANSPAEFIKDNLNLGAANVPNNSNVQNNYTQHLDKVVISLPNVKNYDEFLAAMQKDKNFERLVESMTIGKLAGKSSLAKGKAIR